MPDEPFALHVWFDLSKPISPADLEDAIVEIRAECRLFGFTDVEELNVTMLREAVFAHNVTCN